MSIYTSTVKWQRQQQETFTDNRYSRAHQWTFDGGQVIQASSSPSVVPLPYSDASCVDPEEAFVAALSSCHMLFFLSIAAQQGLVVDQYQDDAMGTLQKDNSGCLSMTKVTLRPKVVFSGNSPPSRKTIDDIHHKSHQRCFIAQSVKSTVKVISQ